MLKVAITNTYHNSVWVRVSTDGNGSDEWFEIQPYQSDTWGRNPGIYKAQVSLSSNKQPSLVYYVECPSENSVSHEMKLEDKNQKPIPSASDTFNCLISSEAEKLISQMKISNTNSNTININSTVNTSNFEKIEILNSSPFDIFIRVSAQGGGSEDWFKITAGSSDTWSRVKGSNYHLEYALCPFPNNGPTVTVRSGAKYVIEEDLGIHCGGKYLYFSPDKFRSAHDNGVVIHNTFNPKPIIVVNNLHSEIKVRINTRGPGAEDYFVISPEGKDCWNRDMGEYIMEIRTVDKKEYRFHVATDNIYTFSSGGLLFNGSGNGVPQTSDQFHAESNVNIPNTAEINGKIGFTNISNVPIWARVKSSGNGSEDIFSIGINGSDSWTRQKGVYLSEVIIDENNKLRYYVNCPGSYTFDSNHQLVNVEKITNIQTTKDNTFAKSRFDVDPPKEQHKEEVVETHEVHEEPDLSVLYYGKRPQIKSGKFYDDDFPPEKRILNSLDKNYNKMKPHFSHADDEVMESDDIVFRTPTQIFGKDYFLFKDRIEYGDVNQGDIGNCYLMSVLAALSKRPELIEKIFKTKSVNSQGLYEVYFYEGGQKKVIAVDEYVPVSKYGTNFVFAQPNGNEIWVLILEKAFAKYEGGYSNIVGGHPKDAFYFFTGGLVRHIRNISSSWEELVSAIKKNNIITAASKNGTGNDKDTSPKGIHYGHAYSLIDAREYNDGDKKIRLVQMRNPWGTGEWFGDYSDDSKLWNPTLKKFFNAQEAMGDDGRFFMPFDDLAKEFVYLIICYC